MMRLVLYADRVWARSLFPQKEKSLIGNAMARWMSVSKLHYKVTARNIKIVLFSCIRSPELGEIIVFHQDNGVDFLRLTDDGMMESKGLSKRVLGS
jgi:hypothetical protein